MWRKHSHAIDVYMKKRLLLVLLSSCLAFSFFACSKDKPQDKDNSQKEEASDHDNEEPNEDQDIAELRTPDISEETLLAERMADDAIDLLTCPWDYVVFQFQNENFSLPFSYARISEEWTFDLADYGYDETFTLQPGERTTATVELINPIVDYPMIVGFYNPYDVPITIEESQIWSVSFDLAETESEILPLLPANIGKGTPIVDVIILYDTPKTPFSYNEETGTYDLYYQFGANRFEYGYEKYVTLFIGAENGLQKFILQNYGE